MTGKKKDEQLVREGQVTYDMYAAMPDDGQRYEVIDGVLEAMSPGPSATHQSIGLEMAYIFKQSCQSDYLIYVAPLDVIFSPTMVLQPDILLIRRSRMNIVAERGVEGPPDLVVEIVSPWSRRRDKVRKMRAYARFGVPEYWVVDPESRTLEQYRQQETGAPYELHDVYNAEDTVASDKLPCVSFELRALFANIPDHLQ